MNIARQAARAAFGILILLEILGRLFWPHAASDFTWLGLVVTAIFAWSMGEIFRLSPTFLWLAFAGTLIDAISALFELYSRIGPWDKGVHIWGGLIIAAGSLELVRRGLRKEHISARRERPFIVASIYLLVAGVGFLYEFWEYLVDKFQYGYPKSLVSAYNSIEDQLFNLVGATLMLLIYFIWQRRRS